MEKNRGLHETSLRQKQLLNYLGSVQFLFKTGTTVALLLVVFTLCSELFKFIREVIARAFFSLEVIEESNFPRNFWQAFSEWVRRLLRRKPIKYVVRWKEIVLPKEIKDSIEKRYKHIQKTIELNMKLTSVERKAGNGEIVNSLIFNGPTGTGKTLIALSIAKRLANKGLVRYAKISASNVSKGTAQEMTIALEKINRKALAYYNRTGKPTGLVMNEFLDMAESRFGQDRTEQTRHFVQKVLQLIDGVGAPHLFIIGTSNYYTKERLAKIDDAVLSRFASRYMFPIGDLPDDLWIELAKKTFIRLARQHKAELRGNFMAPIEDNIQFLRDKGMHGGGLYTNRQLVAFVTEIVMNLRFERVEKKKKKLVITQDDVAEAVEELSRLKGVDYFASDEGYDSDEDEG